MKMQIKYHKPAEYGDLGGEEWAALRYWHKICIILAVVIALAGYLGLRAEMDLSVANEEGFAHWFLICCAYPVLSILGLINLVFSTHDSAIMQFITREHQVWGVLIIDIATLVVIWATGRWIGIRVLGAEKLRIVANFLAIIAAWGILQLSLLGIITIWDDGGIDHLHDKLKTPVVSSSDL